jgi:hypothetical protein
MIGAQRGHGAIAAEDGAKMVPAPLPTLQIQHVFSARLLKTVTICLMAFKQLSR